MNKHNHNHRFLDYIDQQEVDQVVAELLGTGARPVRGSPTVEEPDEISDLFRRGMESNPEPSQLAGRR